MTLNSSEKNTGFAQRVAAANARLRNNYRNRVIGNNNGAAPRFELYHSAPSLCSHKVRTVLAEKKITHVSHDLVIMPMGKFIPENYRPEYVRLRLMGAEGQTFANSYNGESSVSNQGIDPCVVPTLVDHQEQRVIVDSSKICEYVDANAASDVVLIPADIRQSVLDQIALVDQAPHVAMLYGAHPDGDDRPQRLAQNIEGIHAKKNAALQAMIRLAGDDDLVVSAYRSKIAKESAASHFVYDAQSMRENHDQMRAHVGALEAQLASHNGQWACGDVFTMADVMWTVSLYRIKWLGLPRAWDGRTRVADYMQRAFARPAFRSAVIDWPGAYSPSHHSEEFSSKSASRKFGMHMIRATNWGETLFGDSRAKLRSEDAVIADQ